MVKATIACLQHVIFLHQKRPLAEMLRAIAKKESVVENVMNHHHRLLRRGVGRRKRAPHGRLVRVVDVVALHLGSGLGG